MLYFVMSANTAAGEQHRQDEDEDDSGDEDPEQLPAHAWPSTSGHSIIHC